MKKIYIRSISFGVTLIFMLMLSTIFTLKDIPDKIYTANDIESVSVCKNMSPLNKIEYCQDSLNIKFMGLIPLKTVSVQKINDLKLYPGGNSVGVRLSSKGVLIVGFSNINKNGNEIESPAKTAGLELGDFITNINGKEVNSTKDVVKAVNNARENEMRVSVIRNEERIEKIVQLEKEDKSYKLGLWVRDSTAGVGTMTFYHKESRKFGALGHPITDSDTNKMFTVSKGELLDAAIISLRKGEKGNPGELKGIFTDEENPVGKIEKNTECGIFGEKNRQLKNEQQKTTPLPVGFRDEVKEGKAHIITTIDDKGPKSYEIEIVKKLEQNKPGPKSMIIKVTDEELLKQTGGIIQGMSGSPIIQNGKIIGAVTHVLINKPDVGYGIYIDWMLQDAGIIK